MKLIILSILALSIINSTQAEYELKIPMLKEKGGPLPNGSIIIKNRTNELPTENWNAAEPLYSVWTNKGSVYDCLNWTPAESTILKGHQLIQNATDCKQLQTRTMQNREQENTTLVYRNVGPVILIEQNINVESTRTVYGTANCLYSLSVKGVPNVYWYAGKNASVNNAFGVQLNGVSIKAGVGYSTTTFTLDGVKYNRGTTIKNTIINTNYYEVCI